MKKIKLISSVLLFFLLSLSCSSNPVVFPEMPSPQSHFPPPEGLVEVIEVIPTIKLDIRYATDNNFTGKVMAGYYAPRAFLLPKVTAQLAKVQKELLAKGYSLKIFDAYRPVQTELSMIEWAKKTGNNYLLSQGYLNTRASNTIRTGHSCGNSIDLTIIDSKGKELDMGTEFDTFTKASWTLNAQGTVLENRLLLKNTMEKYGFQNFHMEWWHYNYWPEKGPALDEEIH